MNQTELQIFLTDFVKDQESILVSKGKSYSGAADANADRLANFKRVGARLGLSPLIVWAVYMLKHVDSICTFCATGHESEGFRSRALDLSNYSLLGAALVEESGGNACRSDK